MYHYRPVEATQFYADTGPFLTYGIAVYQGQQFLFLRPDVFTDRAVVEHICRLCTREQVEPIHLEDVIYDCL
ncbi:MAG: hypothetical protein IJ518_04365 [Clostridia bacterium]|nr:hypothetical protein [Clostridia bacterium]